MPQVSKYPIRQEVYERIYELLLKTIADAHSLEEARLLLDDLLSPMERIMLAKRLAIAVLLAKGYQYKAIQGILRVSKPTVALVNLSLKYEGKGYKKFVEQVLKEEKMSEFWAKVGDLILGTMAQGKGSGHWRYLRHELRRKRYQKQVAI